MVAQELSERPHHIDDHGAQTMTAARALLHNTAGSDISHELLLEYATILAPASHVFGAFLHDLATVGTETQELADAAKAVWPTLFAHVLDQVDVNSATYDRTDFFNDYALSRLLPNDPAANPSLHNEFGRDTFQWMNADDLVRLIPRWLPDAAGRSLCLLELIRFLRQLPIETQLSDGLAWLGTLCLSRSDRQIVSYPPMDDWLVEIQPEADRKGVGGEWLSLVDRLVHAGNRTLASYSR